MRGGSPSGFSGFPGGSLVPGFPPPSIIHAGRLALLQVLRAPPVNLRQVQASTQHYLTRSPALRTRPDTIQYGPPFA